jgi:xanthine dehydrogenase accessory factor
MITGALAERVQQLGQGRTPFVVATVVRVRHPTSVRPGFSAIVLADGTIEGFVGGVCAESSVRLHSLRALETGDPVLLRLVPGDPPPATPDGAAPVRKDDDGDFADRAVVEHNPCLSGGTLEIFLEPQLPPPHLLILGSTPAADSLADVATVAGYEISRSPASSATELSRVAGLVVASHGRDEEAALAEALLAGVPYVALVASSVRGEAVRAALEVPDELRHLLHTPAGLAIGARTPQEIAISILAELTSERHAHPPDPAGSMPSVGSPRTAVDPVCGMNVSAVDVSFHLDVSGERFYFCSTGCRDTYAREHASH